MSRLDLLFGIDRRTLALLRFALGAVLLWTLLRHFPLLTDFYTDWGVMPRAWQIEADSSNRLSLYFLNGSLGFVSVLLALQSLFALMLMLGWHTRWATLASFVLWGSLMNRNSMVLIGGDLLMACLLFWSCFLPLGSRFSVDAALATNPPPKENRYRSWASAGLLIQVMSVYFFSAILKHSPEWFPDYTAVYYALELDRYATPLGQWLLHFPTMLSALTAFVWWLELLGPLLIFAPIFNRPLRLLVMLAFMAMHVGFIFCLEIGHFPYVSLCSLTVFLGGWVWDALDARHQKTNGGPLRLYYDRDCGFCLKSCLLLQQFLVLPRLTVAPAQDTPRAKALLEANYSWVILDTDDTAHLKWAGFVALVRRSPLLGWLWPLLKHASLEKPGTAAYDFVGRHRAGFASVSAWLWPQREVQWDLGPRMQRVAALFLFAICLWNVASLETSLQRWWPGYAGQLRPAAESVTRVLRPPFSLLRIDQLWNMFAPHPLKSDGWMVIPARLANGRELDLLHPERAPDFSKPQHYSQTHENIRWHTYRGRIWEAEYASHRLHFGRWLCREWNRDKFENRDERLMTFKISYVVETTPPPGGEFKTEQQVLWRHECFPEETKGAVP